ncbi:hypothetical protein FBU30_007133 [Linnemannia zychae]|nr:hypothetical protein FBU30_007133 [Linnemannia zychae]
MGTQPSKLNKVLSRSTTESSASDKETRRKQHREQYNSVQKDLAGLTITPIAAYPLNTPLTSSSDNHHSLSYSNLTESDLTGTATQGGAGIKTESAVSSKTNFSSFLSSIRSKNKESVDLDISTETAGEHRAESPKLPNDLWEQKQQKKINKQNQKAQAKAQKQLQHQQRPATSQLTGTDGYTFTPTSPNLFPQVFPSATSATNPSAGSLAGLPGLSPTSNPAYVSKPGDTSQQTRTSKLSFIRGKAGFAWLEKMLPPASSSFGDDDILNNDTWSYRHGQLLNEMEAEAAKGYVDRITDQHYLMKDVMGGNFHVPIDLAFKRVLENGCGAGDWTLDMASEMPETDFVGCPQIVFTTSNAEKNTPLLRPRGLLGADQSQMGSMPMNPSSTSHLTGGSPSATPVPVGSNFKSMLCPRNCTLLPDVPLNRLPFTNEQFDFVYQRRQSVVLMSTEWQRTILELFRVLKKGGWVQILEPDLHLRGGGELCQLAGEYCVRLFEAVGRNPRVIDEMQHLLESAGFVNVSVKVWSIPLGWGGVIGQAMLVNQRQFVNELEATYVRQGHGNSEEYRELTHNIFEEAVEKHAYINYHVVIAQKPASASDRVLHIQQQQQGSFPLERDL